ncbi:serine/arginine-rich splicing factor RS31 isoform X1 [Tanacetum coccineum]|uniref:Serine/arginine-rich splicing factor RS31 isoform X1 n=1 Tax=Tanacetum coccineum TaxID=301880 RepID=A0ABQ5EZ46_9ASTR
MILVSIPTDPSKKNAHAMGNFQKHLWLSIVETGFEDERDAEDAINALDNTAFGYDNRKFSVEWARSVSNQRPTKTLFVINFDPVQTRVRDIEKHFEPYGKILHVRIQRNFAFVQFETQEEATKALEYTHMRLDEDFVADNDDDGSPSDDSGGDDSDGSASGGGQEIIPKKVSKKEALASKTSLSKKKILMKVPQRKRNRRGRRIRMHPREQ